MFPHHLAKVTFLIFIIVFVCLGSVAQAAPPASFQEAKKIARNYIYYDQNNGPQGTIYCGCQWEWTTSTGGTPIHSSCGYQTRARPAPAARIEWEHVVPAWVFGHQLQCWQHGGRRNCEQNDPVFRAMEADLYNLTPSIGEMNQDRSNYMYGPVATSSPMYGACQSKTDFKHRVFEPRDEVKGEVARITFYMYDRYKLRMSKRDQQVLMAWDREHPVTEWERIRDNRINAFMGHHNEFVTGTKKWTLGYQPEGKGLQDRRIISSQLYAASGGASAGAGSLTNPGTGSQTGQEQAGPVHANPYPSRRPLPPATQPFSGNYPVPGSQIIGNKRSHIYHMPGCASYNSVQPGNRVYFVSEAQAVANGFRKAGNCGS